MKSAADALQRSREEHGWGGRPSPQGPSHSKHRLITRRAGLAIVLMGRDCPPRQCASPTAATADSRPARPGWWRTRGGAHSAFQYLGLSAQRL